MTSAARSDTTYATRLTAASPAAIAVIELSGPSACEFLEQCWRGATELPRCVNAIRFGRWLSAEISASEDVVICWTASDTVEIHCHGGKQAAHRILHDLQFRGAEIRSSREKIASQESDPYIAAAWIDLEQATTEITTAILLDQARGALSRAMATIKRLVGPHDIAPHPPAPSPQKTGERGRNTSDLEREEKGRDFSDLERGARGKNTSVGNDVDDFEGSDFDPRSRMEAIALIEDLLSRQSYGLHLTQPWRLAIIGPPNAGKSSLMNAILGYDRAIVDSVAGTTRDALNEHTSLCGWPFMIVDTAGLRETKDVIEEEGVERAYRSAESSDIVLLLVDPVQGWNHQHEEVYKSCHSKCLAVHTKADLGLTLPKIPNGIVATSVSAQSRIGLELLYEMIVKKVIEVPPQPGQAVPFRREYIDQLDRWLNSLIASSARPEGD